MTLTLSSPAFNDKDRIPRQYSCDAELVGTYQH